MDGVDSFKPDDDFPDATEILLGLSNAQDHSLFYMGDMDYFRFTAVNGSTYEIEVYEIQGSPCDLKITSIRSMILVKTSTLG